MPNLNVLQPHGLDSQVHGTSTCKLDPGRGFEAPGHTGLWHFWGS